MNNFDALRQGHAISLTDDYNMALIRPADMADILVMLDNPNVAQYLFFAPAPEALYHGFFGPIIEDTEMAITEDRWPEHPTVIVRDQQGRYMGMGGLAQVMLLPGNMEVGYQLSEHAWGKGIATAVCRTLTQLAFTTLDVHKLTADCYGQNIGSYKTMEKCGFRAEGRLTGYYKVAGGVDDRLFYGMAAAEFANL
ncbi:GNAT family N-acetyltransferase [Photobacterium japonica]|uniref:GNAT family N-acetyltransferase n=1 Tax=Photobacterium japonica TaxID=2910235 RepID=UPI003D0E77DF